MNVSKVGLIVALLALPLGAQVPWDQTFAPDVEVPERFRANRTSYSAIMDVLAPSRPDAPPSDAAPVPPRAASTSTWSWSDWMVAAAGAVSISFGQVILYTITNKIGIFRGPPRQTTLFLGRLKSYGPLASLVVTIGIFFVVGGLGLRSLLVGVGVAVIAFGIWIANSLTGVTLGLTAPSLHFRRELLTYYAMNFVAGFRSQIFRTYVFILLITEYAFPVERIAAIHLAGTVCGLAGYRLMGHLASRLGGPTTLSIVYLIVALLFIGFATIANAKVLAVLFLLDSLLFSTSVITDAHLRARSQPEYVFSDLGTGITLFHVAGFVAPLLGGLTMGLFGYEGAFYLGAAVALLGVILSRYLR